MEDNKKIPLFKKVDKAVFERIDKFKLTPNYNSVQDFYNGMEEEQQKLFKGALILVLAVLPTVILGTLWWENQKVKADLNLRSSIITKAQEILAQNQGVREVAPQIFSQNPIDSDSMMTSRLGNMLQSSAIDLSKIVVKDFESNMVTSGVMRSEADFAFTNLSTDELMNVFTNMIRNEKFRIQEVNITRNPDTNMLQGQFHGIHFSLYTATGEEE